MPSEKLHLVELRFNGLFDLDGLYAAVVDWSKNYGYRWHEYTYKHKVPSPKGAEQELMWLITKNVTEYISHKVTIITHIWDMTEVTVDVGGKPRVLTNARMYIKMTPELTYDWQKRFDKGGKFGKKLGEWYAKIKSKEIESIYIDTLYYRVWNLHAVMKKYFDMQTKKYAYKGYLGES